MDQGVAQQSFAVFIMAEITPTPFTQLLDELVTMGCDGRHVMPHTSYRAIRPVEDGPAGVVKAFKWAVGREGSAWFPTFDFHSFTEQGYWDHALSPSRMGVISETARLDGSSVRTEHPMLSFAVFGAKIAYSKPRHFIGHGVGSFFDWFVENDGLLLSFSGDGFRADDVGFTLVNHSMAIAGAPCRHMKKFVGIGVYDGEPHETTCYASVHREGFQNAVTAAHQAAEREGIIKRYPLGHTECLVASAREFHEWAVENCISRPELFRRDPKQEEEQKVLDSLKANAQKIVDATFDD